MKKIIKDNEAIEIEKAITFLVKNINETGINSKPVILHSIRVAIYLLEKQYKIDIVIAAILHDVLEDTNVKEQELKEIFGNNITNIVKSVSYNEEIKDWTKKYQDVFKRTFNQGKDALVLKCADIYQNSYYIRKVEDNIFQKSLIEKIGYFLKISKNAIGNEVPWRDLKEQYESERKRIKA